MSAIMDKQLIARVNAGVWNDVIEVLLAKPEDTVDGLRRVVTCMTLEAIEPGYMCHPSFVMTYDDAKALMNQLWHAGVRPTEVKDSTALEAHLSDMRKIAFNRLKIDV